MQGSLGPAATAPGREKVDPVEDRRSSRADELPAIDPTGLVGRARGEVELEGKVLVIKRIRVTFEGLQVAEGDREKVDRVLAVYAEGCPVARSLKGSIEITSALA